MVYSLFCVVYQTTRRIWILEVQHKFRGCSTNNFGLKDLCMPCLQSISTSSKQRNRHDDEITVRNPVDALDFLNPVVSVLLHVSSNWFFAVDFLCYSLHIASTCMRHLKHEIFWTLKIINYSGYQIITDWLTLTLTPWNYPVWEGFSDLCVGCMAEI